MATAVVALPPGKLPNPSATIQTMATTGPISGMYVYRSAMDCIPTCTKPMIGTAVPRYQNHPIASHGLFLRLQ